MLRKFWKDAWNSIRLQLPSTQTFDWKEAVRSELQMYMSFFGFQLSRRTALIHFVNRSGLFTGIL